jgi:hypothetical protein
VITAANVQHRQGAGPLMWNLPRACRKIRLVWADAGYATSKLTAWAATMKTAIQVVAKRDRHVFEVLLAAGLSGGPPPGSASTVHRPRLRKAARQPRSHDHLGHDRTDDPLGLPSRANYQTLTYGRHSRR